MTNVKAVENAIRALWPDPKTVMRKKQIKEHLDSSSFSISLIQVGRAMATLATRGVIMYRSGRWMTRYQGKDSAESTPVADQTAENLKAAERRVVNLQKECAELKDQNKTKLEIIQTQDDLLAERHKLNESLTVELEAMKVDLESLREHKTEIIRQLEDRIEKERNHSAFLRERRKEDRETHSKVVERQRQELLAQFGAHILGIDVKPDADPGIITAYVQMDNTDINPSNIPLDQRQRFNLSDFIAKPQKGGE